MKIDKTLIAAVCCANLLALNSAYAVTTKQIVVNKNNTMPVKQVAGARYLIQMATFKTHSNAEQYKATLARRTHRLIQVLPTNSTNPMYVVLVGPFSDVHTMVQVRQQLLSTNHATYHSVAHHTYHRAATTTNHVKPMAKKSTHVRHVAKKPVHVRHHVTKSVYVPHHATVPMRTKTVFVKPMNEPVLVTHTAVETTTVTPVQSPGVWKDMVPAAAGFKTGPYVGASIGLQENVTGSPAVYKGFEGTVSLGWGHLWSQRFYLAGEVFGGDSARLVNYPTATTGQSVLSNWSFGGDIMPGLMITDTVLMYLRGGVVRSQFRDVQTDSTAWQVGAGGQTNLYGNLDLRAEYIFSLYQSIPVIGKPQVNQFNVGLVYKFGKM